MAVDLLGATLSVPFLFIIIAVVIFGIMAFTTFIVVLFASQIPNVWPQLKCQMKRQASVSMHYVNRRMELFAPKRQGKDKQKNTLDLPKALGAKFDPSGEGMEEIWGKTINYHFFSKTSYPIKPVHAKAVQDFYNFLGKKGIAPNKALIDYLLVENMDSLEVYTEPMKNWVVKNLPLPIATEKEYLLDKKLIDNDYSVIESNISVIEKKIASYEAMDDEIISDKQKAELESLHNMLASQLSEFEYVKQREAEYENLQAHKTELAKTITEIEELEKHKLALLESMDIMLGYLDKNTRETVYTLRRLKKDLQEKIISDGLFVFPKVQELIFAASSLNSSGMNEAVSIANADAYMQNAQDQGGWTIANVGALAVILIVVLGGVGIAAKIAFG